MLVSIITPSVRLEKLKICYSFLKKQTDKNFEWVVIIKKNNLKLLKHIQI